MIPKRGQTPNEGRRKVDPTVPPRLTEVEVDDERRLNAERNARLEDFRLRLGPLKGDSKR